MLGKALYAGASDESAGLPSGKLGSQAVGLLALLAVSGAVAILTLSKQKLWHYLFESAHVTSGRLSTLASPTFSSNATSSSIPTACSVDDRRTTGMGAHDSSGSRAKKASCRGTSCGAFTDNVRDSIVRSGISSAATADDPSCDKISPESPASESKLQSVLKSQPSTPSSPAEPGLKARHVSKKVKFAPDVVEPSGDGREYRGRISRTGRTVSNSNSMSSADMVTGLDAGDELLSSIANAKAVTKGYEFQILAKPKLPANRMALYNGILGYRSRAILDR